MFKYYTPIKAIKKINKISEDELFKYKVTFIIPTYNGMQDGLPELIESIKSQNFPNIEIIAVDSGSTDETSEYLLKQGVKIIKISKKEFRHDYARNLGAKHANGDFLVFTVQDAKFDDPNWVKMALRHVLAFNAVSFSSPQRSKDNADLYAKYLSLNFLKDNNYHNGTIIIGSKFLGKYLFKLLPISLRASAVHIDDTNHLVKRDFFLEKLYSLHTCEDMEFGKKVIFSNKKWVYSVLTSITHSHVYNNYSKYFIRVFVDNIAINSILERWQKNIYIYNGIVDAILVYGFYILFIFEKTVEKIFYYVNNLNKKNEIIVCSKRLISAKEKNYLRKIYQIFYFEDLLKIYTDELERINEFSIILLNPKLLNESKLLQEIISTTSLKIPSYIILDYQLFNDFRQHVLDHIWYTSWLLFHDIVKKATFHEYSNFIINSIINVWVYKLAEVFEKFIDNSSINVERLKVLKWR